MLSISYKMQHFPYITEQECRNGCKAFYEKAVRAAHSNASIEVANTSGILSIKKEYPIRSQHGSTEEVQESSAEENDELSDEDQEVRTTLAPLG